RGRPPCPVCTGSRKVSRMARIYDTKPSVQTNKGRRAAQRFTRSISRRIRGMSRCSLTSPPSHKRVLTIMASAIHTMTPCFLTRISSADLTPLDQPSDQGHVTLLTDLAAQPQARLDHHGQRHPHDAALLLDADLIGLYLPPGPGVFRSGERR